MFYSYAESILANAEETATSGDRASALTKLRELPLADFCQLLLDISPSAFPNLATVLPKMPSDEDQKQWTGHFGSQLMVKSCNIARLFDIVSFRLNGSGLRGKKILDYGCGWGRLLRVMYYYTDSADVFGADPWEKSLEVCRKCGIRENLSLCDPVPTCPPFASTLFDFVFSYSVFTHLSEHAARAVLRAIRLCTRPNGVYVITIRPKEFWSLRSSLLGETIHAKLLVDHDQRGFAFTPIAFADEAAGATYGETSISFDFMRQMASEEGWDVALFDRDMLEPYQIIVVLRPGRQ